MWFGQVRAKLPPGVDGWGYSLKGMMSMVVVGGFLITLTYWALQRTVVPRVQAGQPKKKKQKSNMSVGESFNFLAKSPYIRDLATLVGACDNRECMCIFSIVRHEYIQRCCSVLAILVSHSDVW